MPATGTPQTPERAALRPAAARRDVLPALRLVAHGHSPVEIAGMFRCSLVDVLRDLQDALTVLEAATVRDAIAEARRRGLID
jgi:hypothetical protein